MHETIRWILPLLLVNIISAPFPVLPLKSISCIDRYFLLLIIHLQDY